MYDDEHVTGNQKLIMPTAGGWLTSVELHAVKKHILGLLEVTMLYQGQSCPSGLMYAAPLPQAVQNVLL